MKNAALCLAALMLVGVLSACDVDAVLPSAIGSGSGGSGVEPLSVGAGGDKTAFQDEPVTLKATASGGVPPYFFRWNVEQVPEDDTIQRIGGDTSQEIETLPFVEGRYIYRVRATDSAGSSTTEFIIIFVSPTPLRLTFDGIEEDEAVSAFDPVSLRVDTNLEGDFTYKWSVASGEADLEDDESRRVTITPLSLGEVILRVVVEDEEQPLRTSDNFTLNVEQGSGFLVEIERPDVAVLEEEVTLTATINNDDISESALTYEWEVVQGDADLSSTTTKSVILTGNAEQTVSVKVTVTAETDDGKRLAEDEISLVVLKDLRPQVVMTVRSVTPDIEGDITFELFADVAPKTVANLVQYIDERFYNGLVWHRVAVNQDGDPFVIQTGAFRRVGEVLQDKEADRDPVVSEADPEFSNILGNIAMALRGGNPDSGDTQFFINLGDNSFLDEQSFTVFGKVIEGMDLVDLIGDVDVDDADAESADGDEFTLTDVPVEDIRIVSFKRVGVSSGGTLGDSGTTAGGNDKDGTSTETSDESDDDDAGDDDGSGGGSSGGAAFGG